GDGGAVGDEEANLAVALGDGLAGAKGAARAARTRARRARDGMAGAGRNGVNIVPGRVPVGSAAIPENARAVALPISTFRPSPNHAVMAAAQTYNGASIQVLEGLEPVRKRPGMYIGGTGKAGLHHLVWEIVDNAVDEATNGFATLIEVTLHKDGRTIS